MIGGTVYGVVLNARSERERLMSAFDQSPYLAPPQAPVVYIKPRGCITMGGAAVPISPDLPEVEVAATVALLFGDTPGVPQAAALALDVCEPHDSYYRPVVRQRGRDGFLPLGPFGRYSLDALLDGDLVTTRDGAEVHRWSLRQLHRSIPDLIADLQTFMSLLPGDVLMVGLPGDAPRARLGQALSVTHPALAPLATRIEAEAR